MKELISAIVTYLLQDVESGGALVGGLHRNVIQGTPAFPQARFTVDMAEEAIRDTGPTQIWPVRFDFFVYSDDDVQALVIRDKIIDRLSRQTRTSMPPCIIGAIKDITLLGSSDEIDPESGPDGQLIIMASASFAIIYQDS